MLKERDEGVASEVFDRGRRGEPLLGCDCVTCFGYCIVDHGLLLREIRISKNDAATLQEEG